MMAPPDHQPYDDRFLTQYLLGNLPAEDAESMDILCISDEELATRLSAIENDLVDAYVRGDLSEPDLDRFKSFYAASAQRRQKVDFAAALFEMEKKRASAPVATELSRPVGAPPVVAVPAPKASVELVRERKAPPGRPTLRWGFTLAAAAIVLIAAYVSFDNLRLRRQANDARGQRAAIDQREQQLEKELDDQRAASAMSAKEMENLRQSQTTIEQLKTVSLLLPPPTRSAIRPPTITLEPGTDLAVLVLTLESDDFPQYRAALKDTAVNQVLWSSGSLRSTSLGDKKVVSISFPGSLLKQQNYVVELTGVPHRGGPEVVGSYPFHAVLK
jgi:hypothetical protein